MIKLSKTGWNNVIIFAVMGFILLINATQKNIERNESGEFVNKEQPILGQHGVVLSLTVNQQANIERLGQGWRILPDVLALQPLTAMMQTWHDLQARAIMEPDNVDKSGAIVVAIMLAGAEELSYFMLFPNEQSLLIYRQSDNTWFEVAQPFFNQLIPEEVLL